MDFAILPRSTSLQNKQTPHESEHSFKKFWIQHMFFCSVCGCVCIRVRACVSVSICICFLDILILPKALKDFLFIRVNINLNS